MEKNKIELLNNDLFFHSRKSFGMFANIGWKVVDILDGVLQVEISSPRDNFGTGSFPLRERVAQNISESIQHQAPEMAVHAYWVDFESGQKIGVEYSAKSTTVEELLEMVKSDKDDSKKIISISSSLVYGHRIQEATHFSIAVHEEPVKQKRKGKDVPYVTHPLTVGLILSQAGASEDVVIAGILHDTIEDCEPYGSVTQELLSQKFGERVAKLVSSVTEKDKSLSWHERKEKALVEIAAFSQDSLLVKSGDVISNNTELIRDFDTDGDATFERFNASKEEIISHTLQVIRTLLGAWSENPLAGDLLSIAAKLQMMGATYFMPTYPAPIIPVGEYFGKMDVSCPVCGWKGTPEEGEVNTDSEFALDVSCPICEKMVLVAEYSAA